MSALSPTDTTLLNADGTSDPAVIFKGVTITRETRMDACQRRVFELLREDSDIWKRVQ